MATQQCRVCRGALDARTRTAGGEVCYDCATAPAADVAIDYVAVDGFAGLEQLRASAPAATRIATDADWCPKNTTAGHEPDWSTVTVSSDVELYLDVNCKHCGRSGCLGSVKRLAEDLQW